MDLPDTIPHRIAQLAQELGFLDERKYRNFCILQEFNRLRSEGMKVEDVELKLSEQFSSEKYPLTPETIHGIIYKN